MRRTALVAACFAVLLGSAGPAPAAGRSQSGCAGSGTMTLDTGVAYPPAVSSFVGFTFTLHCLRGGTLYAVGRLGFASCGRFSGAGTVQGLGDFAIESGGPTAVLTPVNGGDVAGGGLLVPVPDTSTVPFGNDCSNGSARVFEMAPWLICAGVPSTDGCA